MMIRDPYKASYGVENAEFAITQVTRVTRPLTSVNSSLLSLVLYLCVVLHL